MSVFVFLLRNRSPAAQSLILVPHLSGQLNTVTVIRLLYYASWGIVVFGKFTDGTAVQFFTSHLFLFVVVMEAMSISVFSSLKKGIRLTGKQGKQRTFCR